MGQCLLADIPVASLQVVLQHLSSQDHASLRQLSKAVCQRVTQHVPYINISLSGSTSSSIDQLQQWKQATRKFQHVSNVHVHVASEISPQLFDLAMQLLSQRTTPVTELHLLSVAADSSSSSSSNSSGAVFLRAPGARVPTLAPLQHLSTHLRTLVVEGVAFQDLASDLKQLTAVAAGQSGWQQLQSLTLNAAWHFHTRSNTNSRRNYRTLKWLEFLDAINQLTAVVPNLKQFTVTVPLLIYGNPLEVNVIGSVYEDSDDDDNDDVMFDRLEYWEVKFAERVLVAAVANAFVHWKHLEELTMHYLPDIWVNTTSDVSAANAPKAAANAVEVLSGGLLSDMEAAAAAVPTLDDYGCWLLRHCGKLKQLQLTVGEPEFTVSWQWKQQQQQQQQFDHGCHRNVSSRTAAGSSSSSSVSQEVCRKAAAVTDIQFNTSMSIPRIQTPNQPAAAADFDSGSSSSGGQLNSVFDIPLLPYYSFRPASSLLRHISSCQLHCYDLKSDNLAEFLVELKSLKHLQVGNICCQIVDDGHHALCSPAAATATVAAAASVQGLQSFHLQLGTQRWHKMVLNPPDDLLLPLTAAAGGPGSSLKTLRLEGNFSTAAASAAEGSAAAAAATSSHESTWYNALQQLDGLRNLIIINHNRDHLLDLAVDCLPAGLEMLEGHRLNITAGSTAAAAAAAGSTAAAAAAAGSTAAAAAPQLHKLHLTGCRLISPSILASDQLEQLTTDESNWSGNWTSAAAAAWPHLKDLVWQYERDWAQNSSSSSSGGAAGSTIVASFADLSLNPDLDQAAGLHIRLIVEIIMSRVKSLKSLLIVGRLPESLSAAGVQQMMRRVKQWRQLCVGHFKPGEILHLRCN